MEIAQAESSFAQKARNEPVEIETKLDRLLDLQLDGSLSQTEYATKKHKLILAKKDLEEKISAFGRKSNNRFDLAIAFLKVQIGGEGEIRTHETLVGFTAFRVRPVQPLRHLAISYYSIRQTIQSPCFLRYHIKAVATSQQTSSTSFPKNTLY